MANSSVHYQRPGFFVRHVGNPAVRALTKVGVGPLGARTLETKGRKSGLPRQTPVNLLVVDGQRYLVAPRGEAEWVRNVRADDGRLILILGRRRQRWTGTEITEPSAKVPLLRAYLKQWKAEVGVFFGGVGPDSTEEALAAIAPRHPVFKLTEAGAD